MVVPYTVAHVAKEQQTKWESQNKSELPLWNRRKVGLSHVWRFFPSNFEKLVKHGDMGQMRCPQFTFSTFIPDPNLHKPRFTWDPYLHSPDLHKPLFVHRFQETQIYTKLKTTWHLYLYFGINTLRGECRTRLECSGRPGRTAGPDGRPARTDGPGGRPA